MKLNLIFIFLISLNASSKKRKNTQIQTTDHPDKGVLNLKRQVISNTLSNITNIYKELLLESNHQAYLFEIIRFIDKLTQDEVKNCKNKLVNCKNSYKISILEFFSKNIMHIIQEKRDHENKGHIKIPKFQFYLIRSSLESDNVINELDPSSCRRKNESLFQLIEKLVDNDVAQAKIKHSKSDDLNHEETHLKSNDKTEYASNNPINFIEIPDFSDENTKKVYGENYFTEIDEVFVNYHDITNKKTIENFVNYQNATKNISNPDISKEKINSMHLDDIQLETSFIEKEPPESMCIIYNDIKINKSKCILYLKGVSDNYLIYIQVFYNLDLHRFINFLRQNKIKAISLKNNQVADKDAIFIYFLKNKFDDKQNYHIYDQNSNTKIDFTVNNIKYYFHRIDCRSLRYKVENIIKIKNEINDKITKNFLEIYKMKENLKIIDDSMYDFYRNLYGIQNIIVKFFTFYNNETTKCEIQPFLIDNSYKKLFSREKITVLQKIRCGFIKKTKEIEINEICNVKNKEFLTEYYHDFSLFFYSCYYHIIIKLFNYEYLENSKQEDIFVKRETKVVCKKIIYLIEYFNEQINRDIFGKQLFLDFLQKKSSEEKNEKLKKLIKTTY